MATTIKKRNTTLPFRRYGPSHPRYSNVKSMNTPISTLSDRHFSMLHASFIEQAQRELSKDVISQALKTVFAKAHYANGRQHSTTPPEMDQILMVLEEQFEYMNGLIIGLNSIPRHRRTRRTKNRLRRLVGERDKIASLILQLRTWQITQQLQITRLFSSRRK